MADIFKPVNFDNFTVDPISTKTVENNAQELTAEGAVAIISAELQNIQAGTSKLLPHAVQFKEGSTPFLPALKIYSSDPSLKNASALVTLASQDFGHAFSKFVADTVLPIHCKGK